jgi:tetratricopeptide (TPR) repeat protein
MLYALYNMDSAEYYALKSIAIKPVDISEDKVMMTNFYVLGEVFNAKKDYHLSIEYFNKALNISHNIGESLNLEALYTAQVVSRLL